MFAAADRRIDLRQGAQSFIGLVAIERQMMRGHFDARHFPLVRKKAHFVRSRNMQYVHAAAMLLRKADEPCRCH